MDVTSLSEEEMATNSEWIFFVAMCVEVPSTYAKTSDHVSSFVINRTTTISPAASNSSSSCVDSAFGASPTSSNPSTPPSPQIQLQSSKLSTFSILLPKNLLKVTYRIVQATKNGKEKINITGKNNIFNISTEENPLEKLNHVS